MIDLSRAEMAMVKDADAVSGDSVERLMSVAYLELRDTARALLRRERTGHTLQPTALVHEAFLLLSRQRVALKNHSHFCAVAATIMRRILVKHAVCRAAAKRQGKSPGRPCLPLALDAAVARCEARGTDLQALDEAMERLSQVDPRQSQIVEMRFFGGLTVEQVAALLDISPRTVHREWGIARAWLRTQIAEDLS
ncbi:MAG: ECF-type sigma factor [Phycisphaerales bacterium]|nr:ECF-type sigma factor [Phycisphaerales bacterium]MCI0629250.1 ECF-type sigma factor [Phycisphaerales bacterium]MCI0675868.1 ECF-type sigma factor [Phycisphaerales bacterium]